jgi:hypothetical protein
MSPPVFGARFVTRHVGVLELTGEVAAFEQRPLAFDFTPQAGVGKLLQLADRNAACVPHHVPEPPEAKHDPTCDDTCPHTVGSAERPDDLSAPEGFDQVGWNAHAKAMAATPCLDAGRAPSSHVVRLV